MSDANGDSVNAAVKALLSLSSVSAQRPNKPKIKTMALVYWYKEIKTSIVPIAYIKQEDRKEGHTCDVKWKNTRYDANIIKIGEDRSELENLQYLYNKKIDLNTAVSSDNEATTKFLKRKNKSEKEVVCKKQKVALKEKKVAKEKVLRESSVEVSKLPNLWNDVASPTINLQTTSLIRDSRQILDPIFLEGIKPLSPIRNDDFGLLYSSQCTKSYEDLSVNTRNEDQIMIPQASTSQVDTMETIHLRNDHEGEESVPTVCSTQAEVEAETLPSREENVCFNQSAGGNPSHSRNELIMPSACQPDDMETPRMRSQFEQKTMSSRNQSPELLSKLKDLATPSKIDFLETMLNFFKGNDSEVKQNVKARRMLYANESSDEMVELVKGAGIKITTKQKAIIDLMGENNLKKLVRIVLVTLFTDDTLRNMTAQGKRGTSGIPKELFNAIFLYAKQKCGNEKVTKDIITSLINAKCASVRRYYKAKKPEKKEI